MVNRAVAAILGGLFPDYCSLCGLRSHRSLPLCPECERDLHVNTACCHGCAIPLPPGLACLSRRFPAATDSGETGRLLQNPAPLCGECLRHPPPFQRVIAPWLYCERLAHLIRRWKFQGERRLTPMLASLWLQQVDEPPPVDLLIPVPLHWRRLWRRGFNQSELLCRQLRSLAPASIPAALDHRAVRRSRPTPAQSGMGAAQRAANLHGAFTVLNRYDNLRIAIVDDVFTTGATAAAMAVALRGAGAEHIEVWCLARTPAPGT